MVKYILHRKEKITVFPSPDIDQDLPQNNMSVRETFLRWFEKRSVISQ